MEWSTQLFIHTAERVALQLTTRVGAQWKCNQESESVTDYIATPQPLKKKKKKPIKVVLPGTLFAPNSSHNVWSEGLQSHVS